MAEEADQGVSRKGSKDLLISSLEGFVHSSSNALLSGLKSSKFIVYLHGLAMRAGLWCWCWIGVGKVMACALRLPLYWAGTNEVAW